MAKAGYLTRRMAGPLALWTALAVASAAGGAPGDGALEPGEDEIAELQKAVQNPVADLISVPIQNNTYFDFGPREGTLNVTNIQPVLPFNLSEDWNLITRTILPIVSQPGLTPGQDRETGLGDIVLSGFLSPARPSKLNFNGKLLWGVGPVALLPTATDDRLGQDKWGLGPGLVLLTMPGNWVIGTLLWNTWSFAGSGDQDVNRLTWQYFVNYNLPQGWYLTSAPIMTANWEASRGGDTWTVPVGGGLGRIFRIGPLPVNTQIQGFYNAAKPEFGADWELRLQIQMLFPKRRG